MVGSPTCQRKKAEGDDVKLVERLDGALGLGTWGRVAREEAVN